MLKRIQITVTEAGQNIGQRKRFASASNNKDDAHKKTSEESRKPAASKSQPHHHLPNISRPVGSNPPSDPIDPIDPNDNNPPPNAGSEAASTEHRSIPLYLREIAERLDINLSKVHNSRTLYSGDEINENLVTFARVENLSAMVLCLVCGADPRYVPEDGFTALAAVNFGGRNGGDSTIKRLLQRAQLEIVDYEGIPLYVGVEAFKRGIDLSENKYDNKTQIAKDALLHAAIEEGDMDDFILLLAAGANPNRITVLKDYIPDTTIISAVKHDRKEMLKLLLKDPRVDPNAINSSGETAAIRASFLGQAEILELLLDHPRVDIHHRDIARNNVLSISVLGTYDSQNGAHRVCLEDPRIDINHVSDAYQGRTFNRLDLYNDDGFIVDFLEYGVAQGIEIANRDLAHFSDYHNIELDLSNHAFIGGGFSAENRLDTVVCNGALFRDFEFPGHSGQELGSVTTLLENTQGARFVVNMTAEEIARGLEVLNSDVSVDLKADVLSRFARSSTVSLSGGDSLDFVTSMAMIPVPPTDWTNCKNLKGIDFAEQNEDGSYKYDLENADFRGSCLVGSSFAYRDLRTVKFFDTAESFNPANYRKVNLEGADGVHPHLLFGTKGIPATMSGNEEMGEVWIKARKADPELFEDFKNFPMAYATVREILKSNR